MLRRVLSSSVCRPEHDLSRPRPKDDQEWWDLQIEEGDTRYDSRKNQLWWTIDLLDDSNRSGTLEFVVPACNPDTFLPVNVHFSSVGTLCDISVLSATNTRTDTPAKYKLETQLFADMYEIV